MSGVGMPNNPLTQMIEQVSRLNAAGHRGPDVSIGVPQPSVRSHDLGRIIEANTSVDLPLTDEERAELDAAAVRAGIKDPRLQNAGEDQPLYGTMEEALRTGESVVPVVTRQRGPSQPRTAPQAPQAPRLPDLKKVEGIDLVSGLILIDGSEFPLPEEQVAGLRELAVRTAREHILRKLDEAVSFFTQTSAAEAMDDEEGASPEVQSEHQGDSEKPPV